MCINPHKNAFQQSDLINKISEYSKNDQFLSVIGDLNIRSEMGSDISLTLVNIFKKLRVKSALQSIRHNLNGKLDYVLMRDDINSEKYSAGTFKNLYSEHKSLSLRICTDDTEVFQTANIEENTENRSNTENTTNTQYPEVSDDFYDNQGWVQMFSTISI